VNQDRQFDDLVEEADTAPIVGWDFSWLEGRATEERPPWGYSSLVADRAQRATAMLDLQTGGGEMLAGLEDLPPLLVAVEGYMPNVAAASRTLTPRGAFVVAAHDDRAALPVATERFDLVTSRHPVETWWSEIARVLRRGGTYLSQQVGPDSVRELSEWMMGPLPGGTRRDPGRARFAAQSAGLIVDDLQQARLQTVFHDIGAVVYFLRLVVWIVPGFSVDHYRHRLRDLHEHMRREGPFVAHASRFLIEAHKP
jgi:SAM-dependent methyltransferase